MLIVREIKENFQQFVEGLNKRGFLGVEQRLKEIIELDNQRKEVQSALDETLNRSNELSKKIGVLIKAGDREEAKKIKSETSEIKDFGKNLSNKLQGIEKVLRDRLYELPNIPNDKVVTGQSEEDNELLFQKGELPQLEEYNQPHWELIKDYGLIDFNLGNKITGAGFPFYKAQGARLVRGLINYFLDKGIAADYQEVQPPILVNESSGLATGQLPDKEGQMYKVPQDNLFLIPTAEVPITNIFRDEIIEESNLPILKTGYSPCFRREAGSYGANVRGLNRLHQFDKVEIVRIEEPQNASAALEDMVNHVKGLLADLQMPYRILSLCAGDLGFTAALTYDFEIFSAAHNRWVVISSV